MRATLKLAAVAAGMALAGGALAVPASAGCQRLGFTVNDYGKDGPTKDAKDLLDKLIATKMSERGITKYTTGKKDVKCELFLNFIVFDEHTCTAEATVCWDGTPLPKGETAAVEPAAVTPATNKTKAEKTVVAKPAPPVETPEAKAVPVDEPAVKTAPVEPAVAKAAPVETPSPAKAEKPATAATDKPIEKYESVPAEAETAKGPEPLKVEQPAKSPTQ